MTVSNAIITEFYTIMTIGKYSATCFANEKSFNNNNPPLSAGILCELRHVLDDCLL